MVMEEPFNRAKIFQPFDALPGLRRLLEQKEREHELAASGDAAGTAGDAAPKQETPPAPPERKR